MKKFSRMIFGIILVFAVVIACEGPSGSEGPQGPQGEVGPIGPAGEDGSVMYAGPGVPTTDIGQAGDYYLNTNTGEYYGPKDSDGWGNPIIVLMGEDGEDGANGSQIYSGNGAPDASLGVEGDYYLDKDNYNLYGPKTDSGWGAPINIKGADGNANVTRYIAPGHDFSAVYSNRITIGSVSKDDMLASGWLVYLVDASSLSNTDEFFYLIPGPASLVNTDVTYNVRYFYRDASNYVEFQISAVGDNTNANSFERTEIVQIKESSREDLRKVLSNDSIIPGSLDTSNYQEVANYYGFYE